MKLLLFSVRIQRERDGESSHQTRREPHEHHRPQDELRQRDHAPGPPPVPARQTCIPVHQERGTLFHAGSWRYCYARSTTLLCYEVYIFLLSD